MGDVKCPKCGFPQPPAKECAHCGLVFAKWGDHSAPIPHSPPPMVPAPKISLRSRLLAAAAVIGAVAGAGLLYRVLKPASRPERPAATPVAALAPPPEPMIMAGRWTGRTRSKSVDIVSDAAGNITGASVMYRAPGGGAAGAGYRLDSSGGKRLDELLGKLNADGELENTALDFISVPPEMGPAARNWHVFEGYWETPPGKRRPGKPKDGAQIRYVLLESDSPDSLCQAGVTRKGFLSLAYFSSGFFDPRSRGTDLLSTIISPPEGSKLASFSNLVWNLSGGINFLQMEIEASIAGPAGGLDRLILVREP